MPCHINPLVSTNKPKRQTTRQHFRETKNVSTNKPKPASRLHYTNYSMEIWKYLVSSLLFSFLSTANEREQLSNTRLLIGHEERQAQSAKARLDDESVVVELRLDLGVAPVGHREQRNAVRPRARAASPGLDPEEIVQEAAHEVVMEVPGAARHKAGTRHVNAGCGARYVHMVRRSEGGLS